MKIPIEIFNTFNNIKYYDDNHKYYHNNGEFISVTTLIHKYQENFDADYWSEYKAAQYGLKKYQILRIWDFINKKGTTKGSIIHDYAENLFLNKVFEYPKNKIINEFGFDPIWNEYIKTKNHVDKFHKDTLGKLIPIKTELVVYDIESMIAGMVDMLFYNVKAKEFQIWDYKTNKDFTFTMPNRNLLNPLMFLEDCDLEIYSLQLGLYKKIIEKNTSIKLGKSYLVWFSHNNDNYQIIETQDREYCVDMIVNERINSLAQ